MTRVRRPPRIRCDGQGCAATCRTLPDDWYTTTIRALGERHHYCGRCLSKLRRNLRRTG